MALSYDIDLETDRNKMAKDAGDDYTQELSDIAADLTENDDGASLGETVKAQLRMTHAEAKYSVKLGIPKKETNVVNAEAGDIKKKAG